MNIQPFLEKGFSVSVGYRMGGKFGKVDQIPGKEVGSAVNWESFAMYMVWEAIHAIASG